MNLSDVRHVDRLPRRFWRHVEKGEGCWLWTAYIHPESGYGKVNIMIGDRHATMNAHRVSYLMAHGRVRDDLHVLHNCDNPPCVRPSHLFEGTDLDNSEDKIAKGRDRHARGEDNDSTLKESDIIEVVRLYRVGYPIREIARHKGVSGPTISGIIDGTSWVYLGLGSCKEPRSNGYRRPKHLVPLPIL